MSFTIVVREDEETRNWRGFVLVVVDRQGRRRVGVSYWGNPSTGGFMLGLDIERMRLCHLRECEGTKSKAWEKVMGK
jgi:hypothetical protein